MVYKPAKKSPASTGTVLSPILSKSEVKGLLEDLAAKHSGDMQTHLAFHRSRCPDGGPVSAPTAPTAPTGAG